jgi:hypothetical protein
MRIVLDRGRVRPAPAAGPAPAPAPPSGWLGGLLDGVGDLFQKLPKPRWRRVGLAVETQLHSQWCWAACSTSVSRFFDAGSAWTQCTVANAELGRDGCCQDGATDDCDVQWYLDRALSRTGNLATWAGGTVPLRTIRAQLDAGRPVGARIAWAGGGGHFVMISGCLDDATSMLEVRDPIYGRTEINIANFASSYQGTGSWTHTYYTRA